MFCFLQCFNCLMMMTAPRARQVSETGRVGMEVGVSESTSNAFASLVHECQTPHPNYIVQLTCPALPSTGLCPPARSLSLLSLPAGQTAFGDIAHTTRCAVVPFCRCPAAIAIAVVVLRLKSNKQTNSIAQRRLQVAP